MKQASRALKAFSILNFIGVFLFTCPGLIYFGLLNLLGVIIRSPELRHWSMRCLIAPDQWWNAALLGEEDETVSSRLGRAINSGRPKRGAKCLAHFVNGVFYLAAGQKNHCIGAIEPKYLEGAPRDEQWNFIRNENA